MRSSPESDTDIICQKCGKIIFRADFEIIGNTRAYVNTTTVEATSPCSTGTRHNPGIEKHLLLPQKPIDQTIINERV